MSLNQLEILGKIGDTLKASTALEAIVYDRIYNDPRQNGMFPYVRYGLTNVEDFDTKTELGYTPEINIDVWSIHKGDKQILQITDIIKNLFHRTEFTGMTFQCVSISLKNIINFIEPDGITTHAVINFNTIFTES